MAASSRGGGSLRPQKPQPPPGLSALPGPEQRAELLRIAELVTSAAATAGGGTPPPPPPRPLSEAPPPSSRDSSQDSRGEDRTGLFEYHS